MTTFTEVYSQKVFQAMPKEDSEVKKIGNVLIILNIIVAILELLVKSGFFDGTAEEIRKYFANLGWFGRWQVKRYIRKVTGKGVDSFFEGLVKSIPASSDAELAALKRINA